jgi:ADP-L-glycero-D-manno-heptose 6-epimerase
MIVVTGAAGFIGSCLIGRLNADNFKYIIAVDDFSQGLDSFPHLKGKHVQEFVDRENFFGWLEKNYELVEFIFHIGARTDTTEMDEDLLRQLNTDYSQKIWQACCAYQIPLVYASSAATYGGGENGYDDDQSKISILKPLNPYGQSKQDFDVWALAQKQKPQGAHGIGGVSCLPPNTRNGQNEAFSFAPPRI